jgi:hypothetical protein
MALAGHPLVGDALGWEGGGRGRGRGGGGGPGLGGAAAAAASAALFAAKRGARRLASGAAAVARQQQQYDDDETRNSASTARARFGRTDDRPWAVPPREQAEVAVVEPPSGPAGAPSLPPAHPAGRSGAEDDEGGSALSGTTAVDRLRADAAADARAAVREAAAADEAGGASHRLDLPPPIRASAAVPALTLGVGPSGSASGRAGWATRRGAAPLRASRPAAAPPGSPWEADTASATAAALRPEEDAALRPLPPPPPPPPRRRALSDPAVAAAGRLAVDFDPPPLMVAGHAAAGVDSRLLATPTPARGPGALGGPTKREGVPACLWAVHVSLTHPVTGELLTVAIPPPADLALPFGRRD